MILASSHYPRPSYKLWQGPVASALTPPPQTCQQAALQARAALRSFREFTIQQQQQQQLLLQPTPPSIDYPITQATKLTIRLPIPSPDHDDDLVRNFDEGEWPGGVQQKFRRLRPLIETFLDGYSPEFIGMLESPADGMGVWKACDGAVTVVSGVSNATFAPFAKLCSGEYGKKVMEAGHVMVAVNPAWTSSKDIGQLWDRQLKSQAAALIDEGSLPWEALYHWEDVRTAAGGTGILFRTFKQTWRLLDTWARDPSDPGQVLLESEGRPERQAVIEALNEARKKGKEEGREPQPLGEWWRW